LEQQAIKLIEQILEIKESSEKEKEEVRLKERARQ
jgi:hypothetical protein